MDGRNLSPQKPLSRLYLTSTSLGSATLSVPYHSHYTVSVPRDSLSPRIECSRCIPTLTDRPSSLSLRLCFILLSLPITTVPIP